MYIFKSRCFDVTKNSFVLTSEKLSHMPSFAAVQICDVNEIF